jgi:tetratricopeptide (TPR) repeat protein
VQGAGNNNLGALAVLRGDLVEAQTRYEEALAYERMRGNEEELATNLLFLSDVASLRGDGDRALTLAEEALVVARRVGRWTRLAWALTELGRLAAEHLGDDGRARACFREAMIVYQDLDRPWWTSGETLDLLRALHGLGLASARLRDDEEARAAFAEEQERAMAAEDGVGIGRATIGLAKVAWLNGEPTRALTLCRSSLAKLRDAGELTALRPQWRQEWAHLAAADGLHLLALTQCMDNPAAAARWLAAAATARQASKAAFHRVEQARHDEQHAAVHAALGEAAFTTAWEAGAALSPQRAIAAALAWLEAAPDPALGRGSPNPSTPDSSHSPPSSI